MGIYSIQAKMKAIKHYRLIWITLIFMVDLLISVAMVYSPTAMVAFALTVAMAIITFTIPYMFGEKSVKRMALAGILVIFVVGMLFGAIYINALYNTPPEATNSTNNALTDGTVTPYQGPENTNFVYDVTYHGTINPGMELNVNITDIAGNDYTLNKTMGLKSNVSATVHVYEFNTTLPPSMYQYRFELGDGKNTTYTLLNLGPINAPMSQFLGSLMLYGMMTMLLQVGMLYLIVLLMYWWLRKGRIERSKWTSGAYDKKASKSSTSSGFTCTSCGADVDDTDKFCPKCGEKFEDEPKDAKKDEGKKAEEKPVEFKGSKESPGGEGKK